MKPEPKIAAGGIAGAATVIVVWIIGLFGVEVPVEVGMAITVVLSFLTGYFKA